MTENEFKSLKVGDKLEYRGERFTIVSIEYDYDYSESPPIKTAWSCQFSNGGNGRITDNIGNLILL